jgi:predicted acylesterase/phospholipase RssA
MDEVGVPIDMIGGTSMGALMAASRARGWSPDETERRWSRATRRLFDPTLPLLSVLSGRRIWRAIDDGFGDLDVEDLWLPFFCVSTNLTRAELVVHRTGSLSLALRASASLPAVLPPVYRDGDLLIDGGLLDTLPVDVMRALNGGSVVVGVDVAPQVDLGSDVAFEPEVSGWRILRDRLRRRRARMPGIVDLLNRTVVVPSLFLEGRVGTERNADVTFSPAVARFGTMAFNRVRPIARVGYDSTIDAVRAWWREHNRRRH